MKDDINRLPERYLWDMLQTVDAEIERRMLKQEPSEHDQWRISVLQGFAGQIMDVLNRRY